MSGISGDALAPSRSSSVKFMSTAIAARVRSVRARRERPSHGRRAAKKGDELAALHSITSSARARSVGGTSRPSAFSRPKSG
jgi:hypothetical protein